MPFSSTVSVTLYLKVRLQILPDTSLRASQLGEYLRWISGEIGPEYDFQLWV